jgi:hypothetical protein
MQHIEEVSNRITELTEYSREELNEMLFEGAYKFLDLIGCTGDNATLMASTPQFWNFWRKQWCEIDEAFLSKFKTRYIKEITSFLADGTPCLGVIEDPDTALLWSVRDRFDLRQWYDVYHACKMQNRYFNTTVIDVAYHRMIKDISKSRT